MLELYKNIKKYRLERDMSQTVLADLTGYTDRSSIAKIEAGEVDLTLQKILTFAKALRVSPGDLMGDVLEYKKNDIKPLENSEPEEIELLNAYNNATESTKHAVRLILGIEK